MVAAGGARRAWGGIAAGVLFVLPVGGADVPIVISLLNAMTGLAVAASGYVLNNVLLLIAGTLVGASGTLLTSLMAKAMGRPLTSTLFGAFSGTTAGGGGTGSYRPVRSSSANDVAIMLGEVSTIEPSLTSTSRPEPSLLASSSIFLRGFRPRRPRPSVEAVMKWV